MWIDGKLRAISVSREAIAAFLRLPATAAAALTDHDRREFVRTHLALVMTAAADRLRETGADADSVTLDAGHPRGLGARDSGRGRDRPLGERRTGDRRKGDRRKVNLGPPSSGERRK
jgi:hypothetical protein